MYIAIFGAPGVGKGSQAKMIAKEFSLYHLSTGELLREAISNNTSTGLRVKEMISKGELVPDEIVYELVESKIKSESCSNGIIFDGFPRNISQAINLEKMLDKMKRKINFAFILDLAEEKLVKRILSRKACAKCGKDYSIALLTEELSKCQSCDGDIVTRSDDTEEVIKNRLSVYNSQTVPVINYYNENGMLIKIDGDQTIDAVFQDIKSELKKLG